MRSVQVRFTALVGVVALGAALLQASAATAHLGHAHIPPFGLSTGSNTTVDETENTESYRIVGGYVAALAQAWQGQRAALLEIEEVLSTIDEEESSTSYRILAAHIAGLVQAWQGQRAALLPSGPAAHLDRAALRAELARIAAALRAADAVPTDCLGGRWSGTSGRLC